MIQPDDAALAPYLAPTPFLDADHPLVIEQAAALQDDDPVKTSVRLFDWVRDHIRYIPIPDMERDQFRASVVLDQRVGYCVQKAILLAALGRAAGIPSRLGFADVRNHQISPSLLELMGTNLFVWHGFTEFYLPVSDGRNDGPRKHWVKATPAFDATTSERAGVLPVSLDGQNDALFHPVDPRGAPFIEYVRERETYADVPYDAIIASVIEHYGEAASARIPRD
jgi:transglutaminase-like putative cysteine protease